MDDCSEMDDCIICEDLAREQGDIPLCKHTKQDRKKYEEDLAWAAHKPNRDQEEKDAAWKAREEER